MIKVISFDFYGTLATLEPSAELIQSKSAKAEGLELDISQMHQAYFAADGYLEYENSILPLSSRSQTERNQVFIEYERTFLLALNIKASTELSKRIWERVESTSKELTIYAGTRTVLESLISRQFKIGVISNIGHGLSSIVDKSGLEGLYSFLVSSGDVGYAKPHPAIFQAALSIAGVEPFEMIHVGDSMQGDVEGALASGIHAVFVDRISSVENSEFGKFGVISSLEELLPLLQRNFEIP